MSNQNRQPGGTPTGGQFSGTDHAEGDVGLTMDDAFSSSDIMNTFVVPGPDPDYRPDTPEKTSNGEWGLRTAMYEEPEGGEMLVRMYTGGMPSRRAENKAVAVRMARSNQVDATAAKMEKLAESEAKVTALTVDSMGNVSIKEGRLVLDQAGRYILMSKGSSSDGVYVSATPMSNARQIVEIESAYGRGDVLAANWNDARSKMPRVGEADFEGIPEDDGTGASQENITAVFMVDHKGLGPDGEGATGGAMFLATDRDSEYGIVNGYAVFPGDSMLTSEHGSMYEKDLVRSGGRVEGFRPGSIKFSEAMALGDRASSGYGGEGDNDIESVWDSVTKATR